MSCVARCRRCVRRERTNRKVANAANPPTPKIQVTMMLADAEPVRASASRKEPRGMNLVPNLLGGGEGDGGGGGGGGGGEGGGERWCWQSLQSMPQAQP